ncbi:MAG: hypothetical protein LBS97_07310, partial [Treponema sp.]|nr:hypothetical protein [Treponema sp.]
MAKKGLLVLVLASVLAGGVWAQDAADAAWDGKKNFVTTDLGLVFSVFSLPIGVRYERLLTPNISVGADFYWGYMIAVVTEFDVGVFAR